MEWSSAYDNSNFIAIRQLFGSVQHPLPSINTEDAVSASSSTSSSSFKNVISGVATFCIFFYTSFTSAFTLFLHSCFKTFMVDCKAVQQFLLLIPRESICIIEFKYSVPGTTVAFSAANVSIKEFNNSRPCSNGWLKRSSLYNTFNEVLFSTMDFNPGPECLRLHQ